MVPVSSISACRPNPPFRAARLLTLRSPRSVLLADQAEKFPDSNPSAKIGSGRGGLVAVVVGVDVAVLVAVGVGVLEAVDVGVEDAKGLFVAVKVGVGVLVGV